MKTFVFLRGIPGCGKSTFIRENNLREYCVSSDALRWLAASTSMNVDGTITTSNKEDKWVWKTIYEVLEMRFKRGLFTVFDATNIKTSDMNTLKQIASKYGYKIYCVDFSDVPIEVAKERNRGRASTEIVPDEAIERMHNRMMSASIPTGIQVIKPENFKNIFYKPYDVSQYRKVHFFGDIHGCYDALMSSIGEMKDDELYVFCGDYVDRGIQNVQVVSFLFSIMEKPNVILLRGNHEKHLENWANKEKIVSEVFKSETMVQLEAASISIKKTKRLCEKLKDFFYATYNGKTLFACHGGMPRIPDIIDTIASEQAVKGVGRYMDCEEVEKAFEATAENEYMIHGHRNVTGESIHPTEHTFNLEGAVESGGALRKVTFEGENIFASETINNIFAQKKTESKETVEAAVKEMRANEYIKEKEFGELSSFNFTRKAFEKGVWNKQTITARGLYINTAKNTIVARSYEKFFRVNENEETQMGALKEKMVFPAVAYRKENGFLGIFSSDNGTPFFATKSSIEGDFNGYFKQIMYRVYGEEKIAKMNNYCNQNDCSLVFEVIDIENDPHIVKYNHSTAILLDIIKNNLKFRKYDYTRVTEMAECFGIECKKQEVILNNFTEFKKFVKEVEEIDFRDEDGNAVEGYVIEDKEGYMVKVKSGFYTFWKHMRSILCAVAKHGYYKSEYAITSEIGKEFYAWLKKEKETGIAYEDSDLIKAREKFFAERG